MNKTSPFFWSQQEDNVIITALSTSKEKSMCKLAKKLLPSLTKRSYPSIVKRISILKNSEVQKEVKPWPHKKHPGRKPGSKNKTNIITSLTENISLPEGFCFEFTPTKAEMHKGYVKLYF